ncbi:MAG: DEAD/DEAH box helicase, partial [Candidatus Saccharimonadales bacterium]
MSQYNYNRSDRYGRSTNNNYTRSNRRQPKKAYIHPSKFIKPAQPIAEDAFIPEHSFSDFNLHALLQNNLMSMGFQTPSPIQDKTIPVGLAGKDIVGIANTGTGKTAAFAIPVLQKLIADSNSKAIILAPTRELAQQIEDQFRQLAKGSDLYGALLIGGVAMGPQFHDLRNDPRVIIGTPGRIKDHLERKSLNLSNANIVVL